MTRSYGFNFRKSFRKIQIAITIQIAHEIQSQTGNTGVWLIIFRHIMIRWRPDFDPIHTIIVMNQLQPFAKVDQIVNFLSIGMQKFWTGIIFNALYWKFLTLNDQKSFESNVTIQGVFHYNIS